MGEWNRQEENAWALDDALARITQNPVLTAGVLRDAAEVIAREGRAALGCGRLGIWRVNLLQKRLESIAGYVAGDKPLDSDMLFDFDGKPEYVELLSSRRMIAVSDTRTGKPAFQNLLTADGRRVTALLGTPVRVGGKLAAVVSAEQFETVREWTREEQNFVASLAGFTALAMESAERHFAMRELAASRRRTETMMSNIPGMVYQCLNDPPEYTITFVSEGCWALTGYSSDELLYNNDLRFMDIVCPDDRAGLEELTRKTLAAGLPQDTTFRITMKDGTVKWVWGRSRVMEYRADGTPHIFEGFYTDITEQRRLEAAELASRAKGEFLANMSHEIRTPMNAVLGITEMALKQNPPAATAEYLENIRMAANSLLTIINDILDFSKIEAGALEITPEPYETNSFISDVVTMIGVRIGDKPLDFIIEDNPALPAAMSGDSTRLKQVLINLLTNAVKFTPAGHVRLKIDSAPAGDPDTVLLKVAVEDTGVGIRGEDLPMLFETFTRIDTKRNRNIEGTGLGLAISKRLVGMMGGDISAKSVYGEGSVFSFEVEQRVVDASPAVSISDPETKRVAIWLRSREKSESLLEKLRLLGVKADIVAGIPNFRGYTHALYDFVDHFVLSAEMAGDTKLIGIARNYLDDRYRSENATAVFVPLTSAALAEVLGEKQAHRGYVSDGAEGELRLSDTAILVVDDNEINLMIAETVFRDYGAEVDVALSGQQALDMLAGKRYDLVFMDHMMPEMDGVETVGHIRAREGAYFQKLPVVALTANAVGDVRTMFLQNGMNDFLSKPMDRAEIERVLREWLPLEKWSISPQYPAANYQ